MKQAFVLGAGLGTRLRPLTDQLPKPLIPVFHRPLITYAFDHLRNVGMREFIVNTHHLPQEYAKAFPDGQHHGIPVTFRHEPVLLETAGGIANIADLLGDESFVVYNGDILTDLPLLPLLSEHEASGNLVTLALRSTGPARHIAWDAPSGQLKDIRNLLGTGNLGTHQFTGIYAVHPNFVRHLSLGKIESVIPIFLKLIANGHRIGGAVLDEGMWWDLGDRNQYLEAHQRLAEPASPFPKYQATPEARSGVSPEALISPEATLRGVNIISPGAEVAPGAVLEDCLLWPGAQVAAGISLNRCIVRSGVLAAEPAQDRDF